MGNMSYCRFHNTNIDMKDCFEVVHSRYFDGADSEYSSVSEDECRTFRWMVSSMVDFLNELSLLDEDGYLDEERLEKVIKSMAESDEDEEE